MSNYNNIQKKLHQFIQKYYLNELIKGALLFFAIGVLYFIFTLFVEHFFWLKPAARTVLFVLFILVELALIVVYIAFPLFKLWGLQKGINDSEAAKIIGNHFPKVSDKLLNMIQLREYASGSELIEASIEQKSMELQPVPFKKAIDFSSNKQYVKYTLIPVVIYLLVLITGNITIFNDSFTRVVHFKNQYQPPAPFSFQLLNSTLDVIEGQPFTVELETSGEVVPEDAKINFDNESYFLENLGNGKFQYTFANVHSSKEFYVEANGIYSNTYEVRLIATPVITNLTLVFNYPAYTGKKNEVIKNTGNAIVPQGTEISWQVETLQTNNVVFTDSKLKEDFKKATNDYFSFVKVVQRSTNYKITTSNEFLKNYESLNFIIEVVRDEFPKIEVQSNIDSISRGPAQFVGQLSDDYGISKLQVVCYDKNNPKQVRSHRLDILNTSYTEFYYVFPDGIETEEGVDYEFYFEVYDNDRVNGNKRSKSKLFSYYKKTEKELNDELLEEQKETIEDISKSVKDTKKESKELQKFQNEIQKKADINWNDSKKLQEFVNRQNQYQEMFQKQTEQLEQNLNEKKVSDDLVEKKEELQKRIEETKKLNDQQKLLEELNKLTEKINKEDLVEKLKDIAKKNKQNEQSLERILELTKRFYVEQKANQIAEKLEELSKEQDKLSKENEKDVAKDEQKKLNEKFSEIKKNIDDLNKMNKDLKRPMKLKSDVDTLNEITEELEKALAKLNSESPKNAKKNQKNASKKMKELSKSMEQSMMSMEGEMIDENIEDLRKIVENLIEFSFQQETLIDEFSSSDVNNPDFAKNIKNQFLLKEYFEHIDDSIYMLSLRLVKMGAGIQKEVSNVHYNMDESLDNFSDNRFDQGISNQRFVLTSANTLANQLSDLLESLMNASSSMGKGKGKGSQPDFALPDIIKKQGELSEQMKKGLEKKEGEGEEKGEGEVNNKGERGGSEGMDEELYEIYKQQAILKQLLKEGMGDSQDGKKEGIAKVVKEMEALEQEMIEQGFTKDVIERMEKLQYELLKLEKAEIKQGLDDQRESETNFNNFELNKIEQLKLQNIYFNYNEILNRQSLPLRSIYKKKVQEYFKTVQKNDSI